MKKIKVISTRYKLIHIGAACLFVVAFASVGATLLKGSHALTLSTTAPTSPPVTWCEDSNFPATQDPYSAAPSGSVTVPAGDNSSVNFSSPNTTYWFAPGTHTIGTTQYSQISTGPGDTYVGAPGAVLDGQSKDDSAFVGTYNDTSDQNVTIEYLTIKDFIPNQGSGAINANGNNGWTEKYDLMEDNSPGAAMMMGGNNSVSDNCMESNGEYGAQGYSYVDETYEDTFTGGATNITFTDNDVSGNNTQKTQEGIEGGVKFWQNGNVTVTDNYFHDNIESPGIWMDTDNAGFLVQNNYISNNGGEGLMYEISYNANIEDNTFVDNGIVNGPGNPGFPTGAIYVSESGGDSSVPSNYAGQFSIQNNVFNDNWSGVVVWQNSNRYPGDGQDPGTLIPPGGTDLQTWLNTTAPNNCPGNLAETSPTDYYSLCQWRSQNVIVQNNAFNFNPSDAVYGGKCTQANSCGMNALFSDYSSTPAYPAYTVNNAISNNQNNHFTNNVYTGPWSFMYFNQGDVANWSQWTSGLSNVEGSGDNFGAQDVGSTYNSQSAPPPVSTPAPSTPTNVAAIANSATSVTVSWNASTDAGGPGIAGYYVYQNDKQVGVVAANVLSYNDTSVTGDTLYSYTVKSYDSAVPTNVSADSSAATVTTPATPPASSAPSAPSSVTAHANSTTSVTVSWNASTDAGGPGVAGYYVLRNGVNLTPNGITSTSYTDTTTSAATSYGYSVESYNTQGDVSAQSATVSITTPSAPTVTPPSAPTGVMATAVSSTQINVSWSAPKASNGISGYEVYRNSQKLTSLTTTSYGDTGLTPSTKYSYYIVALSGGLVSSPSVTVSATTPVSANATTTVEGTVTNASTGKPLSGVYVHTGRYGSALGMVSAYTNNQGQYVLAGLLPNREHSYTFTDTGYRSVTYDWKLPLGTTQKNVALKQNVVGKK